MTNDSLESYLSGWSVDGYIPSQREVSEGLYKFREKLIEINEDEVSSDETQFKKELIDSLESMAEHPRFELLISGRGKDLEKMAEFLLKFAAQESAKEVRLNSRNILGVNSNVEIILEKTAGVAQATSLDHFRRERRLDTEALGWVWEEGYEIRTKVKEKIDYPGIYKILISANRPGLTSLANVCLYVMRNKGNPQKDHVSLARFAGLEEDSECDLIIGITE